MCWRFDQLSQWTVELEPLGLELVEVCSNHKACVWLLQSDGVDHAVDVVDHPGVVSIWWMVYQAQGQVAERPGHAW